MWQNHGEADNDEEELEEAPVEQCSRCLGWAHAACDQIEATCSCCEGTFCVGCEFTGDCRAGLGCGNKICHNCRSSSYVADYYMYCKDCTDDMHHYEEEETEEINDYSKAWGRNVDDY
jgi:hypothetical protein